MIVEMQLVMWNTCASYENELLSNSTAMHTKAPHEYIFCSSLIQCTRYHIVIYKTTFNTSYQLHVNSIRQLITSGLRTRFPFTLHDSPICFVHAAVFDSFNEIKLGEVYT